MTKKKSWGKSTKNEIKIFEDLAWYRFACFCVWVRMNENNKTNEKLLIK